MPDKTGSKTFMANFPLAIPSLGNKFIDARQSIPGDSFTWTWTRNLTQPQYIVIHHTAGPDTQTSTDIALYHINTNKWGGIGYHFVITRDGTVHYVGDLTTARANVANLNEKVIGVCLVGNFTGSKKPSEAQLASTHLLASHLLFQTPDLPNVNGWEDLVGHKLLQATRCPGDTWEEWRPKIISGIASEPTPGTKKRTEEITKLYQIILGRDPDQAGFNYWVQSSLAVEEVRKRMTESDEHRQLLARAKNGKLAKTLAQESLNFLNQAQTKISEITKLT